MQTDVQFYLFSCKPPTGATTFTSGIDDIKIDPFNYTEFQRDKEMDKVFRQEAMKSFRHIQTAVTVPQIRAIDWYFPLKKTIQWEDDQLPGVGVVQSDFISRFFTMRWRAPNVVTGADPLDEDDYPRVCVQYRWYYTDA